MKKPERITETHIYFWGSYYSQWARYSFVDPKNNIKYI